MNIIEIVPQKDHILYVKAEDGQTGFFDVKPYLDSEAFSPLKMEAEFQRIHNGKYFIEWDCGADLSADTIYAQWTPLTNNCAQQGVPANAHSSRS